jgi:hypothetical protein
VTVSGGYEVQTSADGRELAIPFAFEVGLAERLEFLIEPVPCTSIRPSMGAGATGAGEGEQTAFAPGQPVVSELAGAELGGTVGIAHDLLPGLEASLSVSYDNNQAVLWRPGFTYRIR